MSIESVSEFITVAGAAIGIFTTIYSFYVIRRKISYSSKNAFSSVIKKSRNSLDIVGITLANITESEEILKLIQDKINAGIRIRVILTEVDAAESWATSIGFPEYSIPNIKYRHEKTIRIFKQLGVECRTLGRIPPFTFILSDFTLARKSNPSAISFASDLPSVKIDENTDLINEYKRVHESLWKEAKTGL